MLIYNSNVVKNYCWKSTDSLKINCCSKCVVAWQSKSVIVQQKYKDQSKENILKECDEIEKNQIFSKNEIAKILEYSLYTAKAGKVKLRDMEVVMAVK